MLPYAEKFYQSSANAINNAGNIVVGQVDNQAVIWKYTNNAWNNAELLPSDSSSTKKISEAFAINNAGDVIGRFTYRNILENKHTDKYKISEINRVPVVWSGKDLAPTILKNNKNEVQSGEVTVLSADGKIAAGKVAYETNEPLEPIFRATVWTGKDWKAYDLGSFTQNGMGSSEVLALNDDGTILSGKAQFEGDKFMHAALWHIQRKEENDEDSENGGNAPIITPINVDFTNKALGEMANSSFALLGQQYHGLKRVQKGCYTDEQGFCYRTYGDWSNADSAQDLNAGLSLGYQFGNGILVGATLDHSLTRSLPTNYQQTNSNLGLGLFARLDHGNWYVSPSIAWNYYDAKLKRNQYAFTESEEQKARVKGFALGLTVGQDFKLDNKGLAGWYTTLSTTKLSRANVAEKNLVLPFTYGEMKVEETAIAFGVKLELPVNEQLKTVLNAEIEQQLSGNTPSFSAVGQITQFNAKQKLNRTHGRLQAGLVYKFSPNVELSVLPYVEKGIYGSQRYGAEVNLSGRF